jgi:hypothetical protein
VVGIGQLHISVHTTDYNDNNRNVNDLCHLSCTCFSAPFNSTLTWPSYWGRINRRPCMRSKRNKSDRLLVI